MEIFYRLPFYPLCWREQFSAYWGLFEKHFQGSIVYWPVDDTNIITLFKIESFHLGTAQYIRCLLIYPVSRQLLDCKSQSSPKPPLVGITIDSEQLYKWRWYYHQEELTLQLSTTLKMLLIWEWNVRNFTSYDVIHILIFTVRWSAVINFKINFPVQKKDISNV